VIDKLLHINSCTKEVLQQLEPVIEEILPFRGKDTGVDRFAKSYETLSGKTLPEYHEPEPTPNEPEDTNPTEPEEKEDLIIYS